MSQLDRTSVSAFLDGEQDDLKVIEQLIEDEAMSDTFGRYQMIGDVLRGEQGPGFDIDVSAQVAAAIADEPSIVAAPQPKTEAVSEAKPSSVASNVVPLFQKVAHFALAATVAGVVVMGVQQYQTGNSDIVPPPVVQTVPVGGMAAPVSFEQTAPVATTSPSEQRRRINAYLADHQQQVRLQENRQQAEKEQQEEK